MNGRVAEDSRSPLTAALPRRVSSRRQQLKISASWALHRWPLSHVSFRVAHVMGSPKLFELHNCAAVLATSHQEAIDGILGPTADYAAEYAHVRERLAEERSKAAKRYPDDSVVEISTAQLLYTLVRHAKPSLVLEIGVADGRSTQVLLSALDANDKGRLISVDIDADVGGGARGHPRWELRIHAPGKLSGRQLRDLLAEVGPPDLFFHDGSHTYFDQYTEYLTAWEHLVPGGILVSDDVDHSRAFVDLVKLLDVKPVVLMERQKAVGALVRR